MDTEDLTPLGELLEAARRQARPKLSQNEAAKQAGVSGTTWRRVIKGTARFGGVDVAYNGAPDTVARMARVLGVRPEQLVAVERPEAAQELQELIEADARRQSSEARATELSREAHEERENLRAMTEQLEGEDVSLAAAYVRALIDRHAG